jgi:flagellar basal-body rod protein FlgC
MAFLSSMDIAASGITAQQRRLDTITENMVNRETTRTEEGGPYRRKLVVFREIQGENSFTHKLKSARLQRDAGTKGGVMVSEVIEDQSEFIPVYDPNHPDANEEGYVMMPNVNTTVEMIDSMAASRSFSANVSAFEAVKAMALKALEIGK